MKKYLILAVAALALVACKAEVENPNGTNSNGGLSDRFVKDSEVVRVCTARTVIVRDPQTGRLGWISYGGWSSYSGPIAQGSDPAYVCEGLK